MVLLGQRVQALAWQRRLRDVNEFELKKRVQWS